MPSTDPDEQVLRILRSARDGAVGGPGARERVDDTTADPAADPAVDPVLARIGRILRDGPPSTLLDRDVAPPPSLWAGIAAQLDAPSGASSPGGTASPRVAVVPAPSGPGTTSGPGAASEDGGTIAPVIPLAGRVRRVPRRRPIGLLVGAAAAAAVIVAGVTGTIMGRSDGTGDLVAEVALDRLEGVSVGAGTAKLERIGDGTVVLRLSPLGLPPETDAYYEVWLIAPDITRMVSLGPVNRSGVYDVPAGIDPADYPVVDVSIEPTDGTPTHSGRSVLRGTLSV